MAVGPEFATRRNPQPKTVWYECPTFTVVIDHPDGRILFDTSCPRDWETRWPPSIADVFPYDTVDETQYLDASLKTLGFSLDDFRWVVLSHLHFDHAGNIGLFKNTPAELLVQKAELDGVSEITGDYAGAFVKADFAETNFTTIEGDHELVPGVSLISLPGHTWGTMGVHLELPNSGHVIYTSDAIAMATQMQRPPIEPATSWSNIAWRSSVERVQNMAARLNAEVIFGHDRNQIDGRMKTAPAYYD
jgi:glyoxylase-like metal-dependent hydrolase (beta-lactamase superfamily II)